MINRWNYRYELINFQRHNNGSVSYTTRSEGEIPYDCFKRTGRSSKLLFKAWKTARDLAEKTLNDVVVYVIGNRVIPRVRTVNSNEF